VAKWLKALEEFQDLSTYSLPNGRPAFWTKQVGP